MTSILSRRVFLASSAGVGGALALGIRLSGVAGTPGDSRAAADLNAFVRVGSDGTITIQVPCSEMGQGIHTGLAQVVADEMDADWSQVQVEVPQPAPQYDNPASHMMLTVGSQSMRQYFEPLRRAGATARAMLVAAAAQRWNVSTDACRTERSRVHGPHDQVLSFAEIAAAAARTPIPDDVPLKPRADWKLIGASQPRLYTEAIVNGSAIFGGDLRLPGLLYAAIRQCPIRGGRLGSIKNESTILKRNGVQAVLTLPPDAVAVVAARQGEALAAAQALEVAWDESQAERRSAEAVNQAFAHAIDAVSGVGTAEQDGTPDALLANAATLVTADYELPFLAHAPMEPPCCTARVDRTGCEVWVPTQGQTIARFAAAQTAGIDPSRVRIHTTLLGGGFGRKAPPDFVVQAVRIAAHESIRGRPVQLLWSRQEDLQHDFYRPRTRHRLRGMLARDGMPAAWSHRIAAGSIALSVTPMQLEDDVDRIVVEGAVGLPYKIPHRKVEYSRCEVGIRVGFWRSVGWSANTFAIESFIDELANAARRDPYEYRRSLLAGRPRHLAVLERAAREAGWSSAPPVGRQRGLAFAEADGSLCAQVAEISVTESDGLTVHRVVCALDCGTIVNPELVRDQATGGTLFGLSAAMFEAVTVANGHIDQKGFDTYRLMRLSETPAIEVHLIASDAAPTGVGEIATAPIGAAVCNALFAATGRRVRTLPLVPA